MEAIHVGKTVTVGQKLKLGKPYVAPSLQRLTAAAAKGLLSRQAGVTDPELQQMIECVDQLHGEKGS